MSNFRIFLLLVSFVITASLCYSQAPTEYGYQTTIKSKVLNEERTVMVSLPAGYYSSGKKYPVIYLADPDMEIISAATRVLSGQGIIPEFICVSVPHINRNYDLTIAKTTECSECGGAELFLKFTEEELIPFIEASLRTQPYRIMAGSSFGGLFTLYCLASKPGLFDGYIASSPSCWFDDGLILNKLKTFLADEKILKKYIYITMANETGMMIDKLTELLSNAAPPTLFWKYQVYPEEIHGTVPYKSFYDGLKFIFKDWIKLSVNTNLIMQDGSLYIEMAGSPGGTIFYTVDGSEPDYNSSVYEKTLKLTQKTFIKTRILSEYRQFSPVDSDYYDLMNYEKPLSLKKRPEPGLFYSNFSGSWNKLPDFTQLKPVKNGIADGIDLVYKPSDDNFGIRFNGYFNAPLDGLYTFYMGSDDGSRLILNNKTLIDDDFNHGLIIKRGRLLLKAGFYPIEVLYYEAAGGEALELEVEGPGINRSVVKKEMLFH